MFSGLLDAILILAEATPMSSLLRLFGIIYYHLAVASARPFVRSVFSLVRAGGMLWCVALGCRFVLSVSSRGSEWSFSGFSKGFDASS